MIAEGKKYAVNDNQKTEIQIIEAACKATVGDWSGAERIQKKALQNINNSFSEIRLAYRDYARYCLKSGNKTESARAIDIMKELNPDHPETVQLAKRLQEL